MFSHGRIWAAIDALAEENRLTPSGLARRSGLDPTSFNKSKRVTNGDKLRWPSTESISKALDATNTSLDQFLTYVRGSAIRDSRNVNIILPEVYHIPVLGMDQAKIGNFFDAEGFPCGQGWEKVRFSCRKHETVYALKVSDSSMLPIYRAGDLLIVAPEAEVRKGDRVIVKTLKGEVIARVLKRKDSHRVELSSLNCGEKVYSLNIDGLEWIARIIWAVFSFRKHNRF